VKDRETMAATTEPKRQGGSGPASYRRDRLRAFGRWQRHILDAFATRLFAVKVNNIAGRRAPLADAAVPDRLLEGAARW
jgi:hypothetical protein